MNRTYINSLIRRYITNTPSYNYILSKYSSNGNIKIDHWAHRSFNNKELLKTYTNIGYNIMPEIYNFPRLNVNANWLRSENYRIFISQYINKYIPKINNYKDYEDIYSKNHYLAWTLIFGNDINHIALGVENIEKMYDILSSDSNISKISNIQTSRDGNLLQFGIDADLIWYTFPDGSRKKIPAYFVEFVERRNNRDGFEEENADVIFESTKTH